MYEVENVAYANLVRVGPNDDSMPLAVCNYDVVVMDSVSDSNLGAVHLVDLRSGYWAALMADD